MEFIQKNLFLVLIALTSGAMLLWPLVRRSSGGPWVDTLGATQLMNRSDALVIDLRSTDEFVKGHVLGARNVPLADLERRAGDLDKNKARPVIVYGADASRTGAAIPMLRQAGFSDVRNLSGGYSAWLQAGLPVEKK